MSVLQDLDYVFLSKLSYVAIPFVTISCRYMKCLSIGMNPNYVLTEEEKKKRFHKGEKGGKKGKRSPDPRDDSMDATSTGSPGHGYHSGDN